jgi:fumarate reductase subunit C
VKPEGGSRYPVLVRTPHRTWWLASKPYRRFAAREITSMFGAMVSVLLVVMLFTLWRGPHAYASFLRFLRSPWTLALMYHTGTWFRLTTHILVVRLGRRQLPRGAVLAGLVGVWLVVSAVLAFFMIWF